MNKETRIFLPINRIQLFKFTYKYNIAFLIKISLMVSIFAIFLFLTLIYYCAFVSSFFSSKEINDENLKMFFSRVNIINLLFLPSLLIFSIGLSGAFYLMKNLLFQEGYLFFKTYLKGIRINAKEFVLVTLFYSVIIYLLLYSWNYLSYINFAFYVPYSFVVILIILIIMSMLMYSYCQIVIYKNSIFTTIKNSFLFTIKDLFRSFGILAISFFPLLLSFFINQAVFSLIVFIIYICIGFGHSILVISLYCQSQFDKYVNKTNYPEIYKKGLFNEEE